SNSDINKYPPRGGIGHVFIHYSFLIFSMHIITHIIKIVNHRIKSPGIYRMLIQYGSFLKILTIEGPLPPLMGS
ncbi:MAG: hypothetical protein J7M18_03660, partial [Candidatus Eremiobacteraeota bacterium]|nr:hypothetical protein [Candidatus Eremiobacteraeota bacterium]